MRGPRSFHWLLVFMTILHPHSVCAQVAPLAQRILSQLGSQGEVTEANVPKLQVASIRPSRTRDGMVTIRFTADGIFFPRVSTETVVQRAFGVEDDRILGLPDWARSEVYDIQARVDDSDLSRWGQIPRDQLRIALIPLLVSRFNMKFHHETKVIPVFCLMVDKNGPKLKKPTPGNSYSHGVQGPDGPRGGGNMVTGDKITGQGVPISDLVALLTFQSRIGQTIRLDHTIVDRTGLAGKYDFTLSWKADDLAGGGGQFGNNNSGDSDASGPSLFTALRKELGLVLKLQKVPTDVIVVDHIEKPSEN